MANNHFAFYAYQIDSPGGQTTIQSPNGAYQSLPSALSRIYAAPAGTTAGVNAVTILSIVETFPQGLNVKGTKYYTDTAAATLNTAAT